MMMTVLYHSHGKTEHALRSFDSGSGNWAGSDVALFLFAFLPIFSSSSSSSSRLDRLRQLDTERVRWISPTNLGTDCPCEQKWNRKTKTDKQIGTSRFQSKKTKMKKRRREKTRINSAQRYVEYSLPLAPSQLSQPEPEPRVQSPSAQCQIVEREEFRRPRQTGKQSIYQKELS